MNWKREGVYILNDENNIKLAGTVAGDLDLLVKILNDYEREVDSLKFDNREFYHEISRVYGRERDMIETRALNKHLAAENRLLLFKLQEWIFRMIRPDEIEKELATLTDTDYLKMIDRIKELELEIAELKHSKRVK